MADVFLAAQVRAFCVTASVFADRCGCRAAVLSWIHERTWRWCKTLVSTPWPQIVVYVAFLFDPGEHTVATLYTPLQHFIVYVAFPLDVGEQVVVYVAFLLGAGEHTVAATYRGRRVPA